MGNRDMVRDQFSFEKARKSLNCHFYVTDGAGTPTLDGPGSKGTISIAKITTPVQTGLYKIQFGWVSGNLNYLETYIKLLVIDNISEIEYTGNTFAAASATPAIWRDDLNNAVPITFGDTAPVQAAPVLAGGGSFVAGTYRWLVSAVDQSGNETQLSTMLPQEQTASPTLNQQATISWTAVPGAVSYNVYRSPAAGASGTENVFVGNTLGTSLVDSGAAALAASYQGGTLAAVGGSKLPNKSLPAFSLSRPAYGYGSLAILMLNGQTPTWPNQGEGIRIQFEVGDSGAP